MLGSFAWLEVPFWQAAVVGGVAYAAGCLWRAGPGPFALPPAEDKQPAEDSWPGEENQQHVSLVKREGAKMVLVVRTDLGLGGSKVATHCADATLQCFREATRRAPEQLRLWERYGQAKIAVKGRSEDEMRQLEARAAELGLVAHAYEDDGALTVLSVGPGPVSVVDEVTGHLKLY
ncbi:hypothetical protein IWQ56_003964 [Coemansia nantahalensis]|uniref:Uncharacterized protein n=1 Tax=Coemansia nantahalensis TaxID=2789366 RepID=A0ACC1JS53_9FUNG|nr:hypothetical protein IWQ56_003964 [Coemansia nantahalensis]KAJ2765988.1 hypothetical protein IWQ57_004557 [Coemansia nantahalensis]